MVLVGTVGCGGGALGRPDSGGRARGSGQFRDSCQTNADCACGLYCLSDGTTGFCFWSGTRGDPCVSDCDCTAGGYICSPNAGYPVCEPTGAGICVRSGCDSTHPCCDGICCQGPPYTPADSLGTCASAC